jgi:hypothetical protein
VRTTKNSCSPTNLRLAYPDICPSHLAELQLKRTIWKHEEGAGNLLWTILLRTGHVIPIDVSTYYQHGSGPNPKTYCQSPGDDYVTVRDLISSPNTCSCAKARPSTYPSPLSAPPRQGPPPSDPASHSRTLPSSSNLRRQHPR